MYIRSTHTPLGKVRLPNRMIFWKSAKGVGVTFNPKIYSADFGPKNRFFERKIKKTNCTVIFQKWGSGGSKAVWNFAEKSSVLVASSVPNASQASHHRTCFKLDFYFSGFIISFAVKNRDIIHLKSRYRSLAPSITCLIKVSLSKQDTRI